MMAFQAASLPPFSFRPSITGGFIFSWNSVSMILNQLNMEIE
jgi:hypothetical protein